MSTWLRIGAELAYPYLGMPKMTTPAEDGRIGSWADRFAIVWFQLLNQDPPRSVLYAKFRSWFWGSCISISHNSS